MISVNISHDMTSALQRCVNNFSNDFLVKIGHSKRASVDGRGTAETRGRGSGVEWSEKRFSKGKTTFVLN